MPKNLDFKWILKKNPSFLVKLTKRIKPFSKKRGVIKIF